MRRSDLLTETTDDFRLTADGCRLTADGYPLVKEFPVRYTDLFRLDGQTAIVAGGNGGIGATLCEALAEYGANVAVVGRRGDLCEQVASAVRAHGRVGLPIAADILQPGEMDRVVSETVDRLGGVDILVNCVGGNARHWAEDFPVDEWQRVVDLNLKSCFIACQSAGRRMIAQGRGGKIINLSSVRSQLGIHSGYSAYTSSKAAVNLLTKQLATEWAKHKINVNAIAPTFIRTEQVADMLNDPSFYNPLVQRIPLNRVGETDDLVGATLLLASHAGDFITGHILFVDGGVTACQ
jgi:gluconate 5-dehydrogenase